MSCSRVSSWTQDFWCSLQLSFLWAARLPCCKGMVFPELGTWVSGVWNEASHWNGNCNRAAAGWTMLVHPSHEALTVADWPLPWAGGQPSTISGGAKKHWVIPTVRKPRIGTVDAAGEPHLIKFPLFLSFLPVNATGPDLPTYKTTGCLRALVHRTTLLQPLGENKVSTPPRILSGARQTVDRQKES